MSEAETLEFIEKTLEMADTDTSVAIRLSVLTGAVHMLIRYIKEKENHFHEYTDLNMRLGSKTRYGETSKPKVRLSTQIARDQNG